MPKKITLDELARMTQEGFSHIISEMDRRFKLVDERFDGVEERLDNIETRLDRIEHSILTDHRDRIERLEERAFGKFGLQG